jgi:2-dehydro-3-deoxyphosphogluconate aldolase/(4S)-4-hydroxy-2-oxoglutarate aldolase
MIDIEKICDHGVIAIIRQNSYKQAHDSAKTLIDCGLKFIEFTTNTPQVFELIEEFSEISNINIGIGTVLNVRDLKTAVRSGAKFSVAPGTDIEILNKAKSMDTLHIPGVFTPSDVSVCVKSGIRLLKLFPAEFLNVNFIQALNQPFPNLKWLVTGGVTNRNIQNWIGAGAHCFGVGNYFLTNENHLTKKRVNKFLNIVTEEKMKLNENN